MESRIPLKPISMLLFIFYLWPICYTIVWNGTFTTYRSSDYDFSYVTYSEVEGISLLIGPTSGYYYMIFNAQLPTPATIIRKESKAGSLSFEVIYDYKSINSNMYIDSTESYLYYWAYRDFTIDMVKINASSGALVYYKENSIGNYFMSTKSKFSVDKSSNTIYVAFVDSTSSLMQLWYFSNNTFEFICVEYNFVNMNHGLAAIDSNTVYFSSYWDNVNKGFMNIRFNFNTLATDWWKTITKSSNSLLGSISSVYDSSRQAIYSVAYFDNRIKDTLFVSFQLSTGELGSLFKVVQNRSLLPYSPLTQVGSNLYLIADGDFSWMVIIVDLSTNAVSFYNSTNTYLYSSVAFDSSTQEVLLFGQNDMTLLPYFLKSYVESLSNDFNFANTTITLESASSMGYTLMTDIFDFINTLNFTLIDASLTR